MSAPVLWFVIPFCWGGFALLFSEKQKLVTAISSALCLFLAFIALTIPINSMIIIGNTSIIFISSEEILGRSMVLERSAQPMLAFFYLFTAVWVLGSSAAHVHRLFVPIALMDTALMMGVMAVKPFIFGVFLVQFLVLITMPLFWTLRKGEGVGILRFLVFQIFGMLFLAIGGWLTASVEINPADSFLVTRAVILFFLGFVFWLAIFPFHDWIAMVMEETCPYVAGFVVNLLQFSSLFIMLTFLNTYVWMRSFEPLFTALRLVGILMLLIGGVFAFFQDSLQRTQAFSIVAENGFALFLLGVNTQPSIRIFLSFLFIRILAGLAWAFGAKILSWESDLALSDLRGLMRQKPFVGIALLVSFFSVAGLPLFAGFPLKVAMIALGFGQSSLIGLSIALGCWLLIFTGFKLMIIFLDPNQAPSFSKESFGQTIFLILMIVLLVGMTIVPDLFDGFVQGFQSQFSAYAIH